MHYLSTVRRTITTTEYLLVVTTSAGTQAIHEAVKAGEGQLLSSRTNTDHHIEKCNPVEHAVTLNLPRCANEDPQ